MSAHAKKERDTSLDWTWPFVYWPVLLITFIVLRILDETGWSWTVLFSGTAYWIWRRRRSDQEVYDKRVKKFFKARWAHLLWLAAMWLCRGSNGLTMVVAFVAWQALEDYRACPDGRWWEKTLRTLAWTAGTAVLTALVVPMTLTTGLAEALAAMVTVLAVLRMPLIIAVCLGTATVVVLRIII